MCIKNRILQAVKEGKIIHEQKKVAKQKEEKEEKEEKQKTFLRLKAKFLKGLPQAIKERAADGSIYQLPYRGIITIGRYKTYEQKAWILSSQNYTSWLDNICSFPPYKGEEGENMLKAYVEFEFRGSAPICDEHSDAHYTFSEEDMKKICSNLEKYDLEYVLFLHSSSLLESNHQFLTWLLYIKV